MKKLSRETKTGRKIIAAVKSYLVVTQKEMMAGKLDKRGEEGKIFANVIPKKPVPVGSRICLRIAIRKYNNNLLVYLHSFGWIETTEQELNDLFKASKPIDAEDLLFTSYSDLSIEDKIKLINKYCQNVYNNYTKTEKLLLAYLEGKDLNEAEKEIAADSSLKYKIRKNPEKYEQIFIKKLEEKLLA